MRGIFTRCNLLYAFVILFFQFSALQASSQNNNPTTCANAGGGGCGNVEETFNIDNGDFSSPPNNFIWTNDFNNWRATLTASNTYTITSGLYSVGNITTATVGFAVSGSGGNDISSYTINIRNVTGALIATCQGSFTTPNPNAFVNICTSLNDLDIQNQTVRIEFVFTASATAPAGDVLIFNDFRTNLTPIPACNSVSTSCLSGVTEDFNDGSRGGFTASTGFVYNPGTNGDGFFELPNFSSPTYSNRTFTLVSGLYQVAATAFTVTTGFDYNGGLSNDVASLVVNLRDAANNIVASCNFIGEINPGSTQICLSLNGASLVNQAVRVEFVFNMDDNAGGDFQFDDFRINLPEATPPLPVDFISFTAQKAPAGVLLTWNVANEVNVNSYEVERSTDGVNFTKIGSVSAAGSSSYNFTDLQPLQGTSYYRVRNVDIDGKFAYTTVVRYNNGRAEVLSKVYPTTTRGLVTLQHAPVTGKALITITSTEGRILRQLSPVRGGTSTPIDLSSYATGTYLLRYVKEDGQAETFRIIKQ